MQVKFSSAPDLAVPDASPRVLIAHPGRQHSHQAALALSRVGMLACYASGVPVNRGQLGRAGSRVLSKLSAYDDVDLPTERLRLNMLTPVLNRILPRSLPEAVRGPIMYESYRAFDRWTARLIASSPIDAVVAYENSAFHTFKAAKKIGAACILDAASFHHAEASTRIQNGLPRAYKARVDRMKDQEIGLADVIFTASDLAAESYRSHISTQIPVQTVGLGVDTDLFRPSAEAVGRRVDMDTFTFVFVGTATRFKGFDLIVEALEALRREELRVKLLIAGEVDHSILGGQYCASQAIEFCGRVRHTGLVDILRRAHCLLLPSRLDSFGMVVAEAMSCGLPVIVSDMVGAKGLVQDGRNGFVVPSENAAALAEKMRWFVLHRASLPQMSIAARIAAEQSSWECYRSEFAAAVRSTVELKKAIGALA